jgi:hypothetical protein
VFVSCRALAGDSRGGRAESAVEVSVEDGRAYGCIQRNCGFVHSGYGLSQKLQTVQHAECMQSNSPKFDRL